MICQIEMVPHLVLCNPNGGKLLTKYDTCQNHGILQSAHMALNSQIRVVPRLVLRNPNGWKLLTRHDSCQKVSAIMVSMFMNDIDLPDRNSAALNLV